MTNFDGWQEEASPFHEGEKAIHDKLGISDRQEHTGRMMIRHAMPDQHREFFEKLPFLVVGSIDKQGNPWASMLFGKPGFIRTPDDKHLDIKSAPNVGDPLLRNLEVGSPQSYLGIELSTYRRNRINVTVNEVHEDGITARVDQSFGNCPKYINKREFKFLRAPEKPAHDLKVENFTSYDDKIRQLIKRADTFFVASHASKQNHNAIEGVDVNHRGGPPGFIQMQDNVLTIPDYFGNFSFNTLGNFMVNQKAGLLFVDFETGDMTHLTGTTKIIWDDDPSLETLPGAQRAWQFYLSEGVSIQHASPLQWEFEGFSPSFKRR